MQESEKVNQTYPLDVIEMNVFEKIKSIKPKTIIHRIFLKIWFIKSLISYICYSIITHKIFEFVTLGVIVFNSIVLAFDDPKTIDDNNAELELGLLILYSMEMILKILGLGFLFVKGAYLRDPWNVLDFTIVFTGYLPYFLKTTDSNSNINLSSLRSLRVLRPLRTISSIKNLRKILIALFNAVPLLKDSIIVLLFFYIVFAIAGL
jgi:hypothetical protein